MRANWNISTRFVRNNIAFRMSSSNSKLQIGLTQQQHQKILFRRASIEEDHHRIHMNTTSDQSMDVIRRKRAIYRSKQRGWLEVDLLLGSWAAKHVMSLNDDDLKQYEDILNEETVHIFHFLTAKGEIPKHLDTPMLKTLQQYCASSPLGKASVQGFTSNKQYMSN